jgi:YVTN family beta-propeller protein
MKFLFSFIFLFAVNIVFGTLPHAYVTDLGGTSVSIIDVEADTVQKIFGFNGPHVVRVTNDGTSAYVGDQSDTIYQIDCIQHTVSAIGTLSSHPVALDILPNSTFLYTANDNGTVTIVDLTTNTIVGEISGFSGVQDIRAKPDGAYLYVTNKGNGTISIISTATNTIVDTITGLINPVGIAFTIDGTYAYVTDTAHNAVYVIDTSTNTIDDIILGFNQPGYTAVTPDKTTAYVTNGGNDTVSVVRTSDNFIIGTLNVPEPHSVGVTPDGIYLYVGSDFGDVIKIEILTGAIDTVLPGFENPANLAFTTNNAPPDTVNGWQVATNPSTPYNQVSWLEPEGSPAFYTIYRDSLFTQLVATITGGNILLYNDLNREVGQTYSYYVIANYPNGFSSTIGSIIVTPDRIGLPRT